jgi:hypothetical protein
MSKNPLLTTAVASMFAGELFLMHRNIEDHQISWPIAFMIWLCFGIAAGYAGDQTYNRWQTTTNSPTKRFFMLWAVIAVIFIAAYLMAQAAFFLA